MINKGEASHAGVSLRGRRRARPGYAELSIQCSALRTSFSSFSRFFMSDRRWRSKVASLSCQVEIDRGDMAPPAMFSLRLVPNPGEGEWTKSPCIA